MNRMEGSERREKILELLQNSTKPVSGSEMASIFDVSRQVIVQDIALLRAVNKNILATSKGYILYQQHREQYHRCYCVHHTYEEMTDELMTIVENGGKVLDVTIDHDVYGPISVDLILENRRDVENFLRKNCQRSFKAFKYAG